MSEELRSDLASSPFGELEPDKDARTWGALCHISSFCSFAGIPGFVGPLVCWLIKKDEYPFVDDQGKEALNFRISVFVFYVFGMLMVFCFYLGLLILIPLGLFDVVITIIATIKASNGEPYRYPLNLRLIK